MYKLFLEKRVYKDLDVISVSEVIKIERVMHGLEKNPRPIGSLKLQGYHNRYRVRQGVYRIIYCIDDIEKSIMVMLVAHRKDVYRK